MCLKKWSEQPVACQDQQISSQKINFQGFANFVTASWTPPVTLKAVHWLQPLKSDQERQTTAKKKWIDPFSYQIVPQSQILRVRPWPGDRLPPHVGVFHRIPALISMFSFARLHSSSSSTFRSFLIVSWRLKPLFAPRNEFQKSNSLLQTFCCAKMFDTKRPFSLRHASLVEH